MAFQRLEDLLSMREVAVEIVPGYTEFGIVSGT
jgi:hypothetical protein